MAATSCPTCGKPIRPGAKFCGSCGTTLAPTGGSECPHCGKPVREGAKFCSHCGQTIETAVPAPAEPATTAPDSVQPAETPAAAAVVIPAQPEAVETAPVAEPAAPSPQRRYRYLPWFVLLLIIVCLAVIGVGLWISDPLGIFSVATETPTVTSAPSETTLPSTEQPTLEPTETQVPTEPTASEPSTATESPTPEEITPSATVSPPKDNVILEEEFESILADNWRVWGKPHPLIERGFGDNYLSLTSTGSAEAGVSSKAEFPIEPGLAMLFDAQLQPVYPQYALVFSWDPLQFVRTPGNNEPGVIQLEIYNEKIVLRSALTNGRCDAPVPGVNDHVYQIKIKENYVVELFVDDEAQPVCIIDNIGLEAPIPGRITFRDMGLVSSVFVTGP